MLVAHGLPKVLHLADVHFTFPPSVGSGQINCLVVLTVIPVPVITGPVAFLSTPLSLPAQKAAVSRENDKNTQSSCIQVWLDTLNGRELPSLDVESTSLSPACHTALS